jgi:hypothetical protein
MTAMLLAITTVSGKIFEEHRRRADNPVGSCSHQPNRPCLHSFGPLRFISQDQDRLAKATALLPECLAA